MFAWEKKKIQLLTLKKSDEINPQYQFRMLYMKWYAKKKKESHPSINH